MWESCVGSHFEREMATAAYRVFRGSNRARISSIIRYGSQSLSSQAQISKLRIVFGSQTVYNF